MKTSPLLLALLSFATALPSPAQQPVRGQPSLQPSARTAADAGGDLKRFNLDFPGGTPDQFVAAISKALGQPLNAIIPIEQKQTKLMPIKVVGVTVPELFSALETASAAERPVVTGTAFGGAPSGRRGGTQNVSFRSVSMGFRPNTNIVTDTTVWSFFSTEPPAELLGGREEEPPPEQVCEYFQLAPYLEDHTIEDITTAIQTGWKMLKIDPQPQLSFHAETKLLIAVGPAAQIQRIPIVLQQLQQDTSASVDKIAKWQTELAEIEKSKKEPGGEKRAEELRERIDRLVERQHARDTLNGPPPFGQPVSGLRR